MGRILLIDDGDTLLDSNANLRYRGATSLIFDKRSYAVKLKDGEWKKRSEELLGMRKDNYWILDAVAMDMSRMRNRVAMDLWLDCGRTPVCFDKSKAIANGTRGSFVELYYNDRYDGIYCLSERIDRKQLGLKKAKGDTLRGSLAKATIWNSNTRFFATQNNTANDSLRNWGGFEAHYPDIDEAQPWSWSPYTELFDFVQNSGEAEIRTGADMMFDLPVLIDYALFVYLIEAEDNLAKNFYLANYDIGDETNKWFITPWDLDHSFGRRYDSTKQDAEIVLANFLSKNLLMQRLCDGDYNLMRRVRERYAELRGSYFTAESIMARFEDYGNALEQSGAWDRERDRWNGNMVCPPPIGEELQYIRDWVEARLSVIDKLFMYNDDAVILISADDDGDAIYYTVSGIQVRRNDLHPGGIYVRRKGTASQLILIK